MNTPTYRYLFTTWEGGGNVAPALTLARQLQQHGHHVRFMCDEVCRAETQAAGIDFRPWHRAPSRPDRTRSSCPVRDWEATSPQEGILWLIQKVIFGRALDYALDVAEELDREPADVVVNSEMLPGVVAACESRGQKQVLLSANLCFLPLPGMPAFGPGLPPPRTAEEQALHEQIMAGTSQLLDAGLPGLNHARSALGLPELAHSVDQFQVPPLFLVGSSRAFDWPLNPPPKVHYVGPLLDEPGWVNTWQSPWPGHDQRPLVMIGFSTSFQNHAGVLQQTINAAAGLPVRALVTLGQIEPQEVQAAANTVILPSAPHNAVMQQAAIVVTHGGHGTVMRALQHRLPLLIIPHGRDQDENAVRVVERGAGLRLTAVASQEEIQAALHRLLAEPSFAQAARHLGDAIEHANDDSAIELLERFATPARRTPVPLATVLV